MPSTSAPSSEPSAGIWSLDGQQISLVQRFDAGPAVVLVPTESVLLTIVDLPLSSRRARIEALPFAIEDRIGEPLASVHAALGSEVAPGRYLAGVTSLDLMRRWSASLEEAGLEAARLVPDALALPVPGRGAWSVDLAGGRAMVRTDDGAGFALPAANLENAWRAAGSPSIRAYGEALAFADGIAEIEVAQLASQLTLPALDLRQGIFAPPRRTASPLLRRIVAVAGIGLLAHGAIAAADTLALDRIAQRRTAETRMLVQQVAPGAAIGDDLAGDVADLLPSGGSSDFLPLVGRISAALAPLGGDIILTDLSYDDRAHSLAIDVDAPDGDRLQRVSNALRGAGLDVQAGATRAAAGKASGAFLIRSAR